MKKVYWIKIKLLIKFFEIFSRLGDPRFLTPWGPIDPENPCKIILFFHNRVKTIFCFFYTPIKILKEKVSHKVLQNESQTLLRIMCNKNFFHDMHYRCFIKLLSPLFLYISFICFHRHLKKKQMRGKFKICNIKML